MVGDGKRVALVIGIGASTAAPPLWILRKYASAISVALGQFGSEVIPDLDLGRYTIEDKFAEFATAFGGDAVSRGPWPKGVRPLLFALVDAETHRESSSSAARGRSNWRHHPPCIASRGRAEVLQRSISALIANGCGGDIPASECRSYWWAMAGSETRPVANTLLDKA